MGKTERSRVFVAPGGPWKLYQRHAPDGWDMLGTVQRGLEIGALARNRETGEYAQMNAGAIRSLDQRKVAAALQQP